MIGNYLIVPNCVPTLVQANFIGEPNGIRMDAHARWCMQILSDVVERANTRR